jgi:hypothetical protein
MDGFIIVSFIYYHNGMYRIDYYYYYYYSVIFINLRCGNVFSRQVIRAVCTTKLYIK